MRMYNDIHDNGGGRKWSTKPFFEVLTIKNEKLTTNIEKCIGES